MSAGQSGVSIKLAAAFESWCLVYIHCYQEAGSKVGIYNAAVDEALSNEITKVQNKFGAENPDKAYFFFCIPQYYAG